jgi:signal peptidase I
VAPHTIYPPEFERRQVIPLEPPDLPPFQVPMGYFFVLGDNRGNSEDSRVFGPVPRELLVGVFAGILFDPKEQANHE